MSDGEARAQGVLLLRSGQAGGPSTPLRTGRGQRGVTRVMKHVFVTVCLSALAFCSLVIDPGPAGAVEVADAKVMEVAKELACLCGSCPTRPLDECRCGYAGEQRERIAEALEKGQTKDLVIAGFVGEFGERIFVTPPAEGFNLMAWFMPIFGIVIGGFAVRSVLRGWSRKDKESAGEEASGLSDEDRAKLEEAMKE